MAYRAKPLSDRFWPKVDRNGPVPQHRLELGPCWVWTASTRRAGHGQLADRGTTIGAHRASWIIHHGPVPDGLFVLHRCDNPPCVNPDHLFLGTQQDNVDDMVSKGRGVVPIAPVLRGTASPNAKLKERDIHDIRRRRLAGETGRAVAAAFGISPAQVSRIFNGRRWSHLG